MRPFRLEQQYREHYRPGMLDLSSSAPCPLTAREVIEAAGIGPEGLLDAPLEYERGGGSDELRAAIAALYAGARAPGVLVTAGASEAIRAVATALVQPGDCVVVQAGAYAALAETPAALGARVQAWHPERDGSFDFDSLPAEARGARAIIYNNPHGPTGSLVHGAYDGDARLVADEVYRPATLVPCATVASSIALRDDAVSIGDLSKPLGLGGLRIGWIASHDRALLNRCAAILDYLSGSVSSLSSRIALAALGRFDALLDAHLVRARAQLSVLAAFVERHEEWMEWTPPQAGYTAFLRLRSGAPGGAFFDELDARGVFVLDGDAFGRPECLRIGFGLASGDFAAGFVALGEALRAHVAPGVVAAPAGDVIVLAKAPIAGYAKTRLAASIGGEAAARMSAAFLDDTLAFAAGRARRLYIACAPSPAPFHAMAPAARCFTQPDGDLGARLAHAFETAFRDGAERPVLIGADSPTLPAHLLAVADHALETHDVVLGPAEDGGYYLAGMRRSHTSIFREIDWSTDRVLAQTIERARDAGLRVFFLPYWYDIDDARSLDRLSHDAGMRRATRDALKAHALVGAAS